MFVLLVCLGLFLSQGNALTVQQASLTYHNDARRAEAKAENAANIYELVWDNDLATGAQAWADKCNFEHQHIHGEGENLYYRAPRHHPDSDYIKLAVDDWMSEKSYNTDGSFDCCYHGQHDCCHYTQVVAARTMKVGCAVGHCDVMKRAGHVISHNAAFVVCDYSPISVPARIWNLPAPGSQVQRASPACSDNTNDET
ncbi:peptidase inhibitor 15-A-like [Babylonia areolata]|uniref:peptidase inhibitor 15-A-like n=1 Tax=Babylonia areolata TaxID=304850 RepID=UPI003FD61E96